MLSRRLSREQRSVIVTYSALIFLVLAGAEAFSKISLLPTLCTMMHRHQTKLLVLNQKVVLAPHYGLNCGLSVRATFVT